MLDNKNLDMVQRMFDSAAEIKNKLNKSDADMIFYIQYHLKTERNIIACNL